VRRRYRDWALRSCSQANCFAVPFAAVIVIVLVALIVTHPAVAREIFFTATAAGLGTLACRRVYRSRQKAMRRQRSAAVIVRARQDRALGRPAVRVLPADLPVAEPCVQNCGRPAEFEVAGQLLCEECADRLPEGGLPAAEPLPSVVRPADDNRPAVPDPAMDEFAREHQL
jgi:hypothetical protein